MPLPIESNNQTLLFLMAEFSAIHKKIYTYRMQAKKHISGEEAKRIGEELGIIWDKFDINQFKIGMQVELEHGTANPFTNVTNDDLLITGKIALAHLNEMPDYYTRLLKMEQEAEVKSKSK